MSLNLNVIIVFNERFKENIDLTEISDACFDIISEACKRKLAISQISFRDGIYQELQMNEMKMEICDSYIFGEAEKILRDDFSIPIPSHFIRLKNLQGLLEYIFNLSIVNEIVVIMNDDGNFDFVGIKCPLTDFANVMQELLFQKISFAYKCRFTKN